VSGTWGRTHEFYGEYYAHLSASRIGLPEVRGLNLVAGINAGNKYSDLKQRTRAYLLGASYDVKLGTASLNLMLATYSDHSRSRFGAPDYRTTYQFTPSGTFQLSDDFSLSGYMDFIGSKGAGTASQIGTQIQLRYDLKALVGQPSRAFVGMEYQYFRNKFGVKGLNERVPQLLVVWRI
jgi:nucleoside-specific outer membrane channel protein Tsx